MNDQYFKTLLQNHFESFLKFSFPEIHAAIDFTGFSSEEFLNQEQLSEIDGQLHRLDLVTKVKLKNHDKFDSAYAIVFIESQHTRTKEFPERVFRYFCQLYLKFKMLILPIVIYSDKHQWKEPERWQEFKITFLNHQILDFQFFVYKPSLGRLKDYLRSDNPAELALAALMNYNSDDLIQLKIQLIRQLNKLNHPQNQKLDLFKFIDHYLESTGSEFKKELDLFNREQDEDQGMLVEHFTNLGRQEGVEQVLEQGKAQIINNLIENNMSWVDITRMTQVTKEQFLKWNVNQNK